MNFVVAGAVAAAPGLGCGTAKPTADAASHMDASESPDKADTAVDMTMAMDTAATDSTPKDTGTMDTSSMDVLAAPDAGTDAGTDAGDDASLDAYPDGIRG